ncbi:MAG: peptide chain release factor 2 [Magnetococcales bacterium]|nr:peptide chain release factor 2 [Magnetococcales bacterium]
MQAEHKQLVAKIEQSLELLRGYFDLESMQKRLDELNKQVENPDLWNDAEKARGIMQEKSHIEGNIQKMSKMSTRLEDAVSFIELGEAEDDKDAVIDGENELHKLLQETERLETERLLSGKADRNNAFIEVHSGAGGTESQDWASMLMRMYLRWGERNGFKVEIVDETKGDEAGIKSAVMKFSGPFAYGLAKTESGVHRLVRVSPFDSQNRRHTSFASVFSYPEVDDSIEVEINPSDLRVDTYRASGAGGQHVNTTDSAVRITHEPTGIVVQCQNQRSQHKNKDEAMKMLQARLYELEIRKQEEERDAVEATKTDNGWGHQIRSYVLHPYQMVKDLRTGAETGNTSAVLDGDIDNFISEALAARVNNVRGAKKTD